ncbi:hypothetical protein [Shewanella surugensis]|uniref:HEPN domain-containing protein n=1 Tax=Shewanella surugensis TaxID=212020 RepID=A0ABT0LIG9_9GAMM|nr:hypothetical protein [Shewanella surugensis]MCL1127389.1 hypothetical protein [Shewanella surugensis]
MGCSKYKFIEAYFNGWGDKLERAKFLTDSKKFHLEGLTVLLCHISALARGRYPELYDRDSFKKVVKKYSGKYDLFENIDLLFLFQYQDSKVSDCSIYKKLTHYDEIILAVERAIGTEEDIHGSCCLRYQKREKLLEILKNADISGFNCDNFEKYIELFSNNQILYDFARCEAVHNQHFPLINIGFSPLDKQESYTSNHQIDSKVLTETLYGLVENLKIECLEKELWPCEL